MISTEALSHAGHRAGLEREVQHSDWEQGRYRGDYSELLASSTFCLMAPGGQMNLGLMHADCVSHRE